MSSTSDDSSRPGREPIGVVLGPVSEAVLPVIRGALPDEDFVRLAAGAPASADPTPEVLVTLLPEREALRRAVTEKVRWIHVLGAGVDAFPLDLVGDRVLTCSRGAAAPAMAEWVLASMLTFEKHMPESWLSEPPPRWNLAGLGGLRGATLGIVGLGAIGVEVARRALAFDMRVVAVRRTGGDSPIEGVSIVPLPQLLADADHVVISAPATPQTHHLINADALAAVKPGVHLVNVARGSLVDQEALRSALDDGRVAMASLDVVDPEPLPEGHWLYSHPKVRVTPHVSWSSPDTFPRTLELFAENLRRYRGREPLEGLVNVKEGY